MIDQSIIDKYKNVTTILYPVIGGGDVIGQEVSEDNRLIYIIRKDNRLFAEYAENIQVVKVIKNFSTTDNSITKS